MVHEDHGGDSRANSEDSAESLSKGFTTKKPILTSKAHLRSQKTPLMGSHREQARRRVDTVLQGR